MTVILILSYYESGKRQTRKSKTKNSYRYQYIKKKKPKIVLDDIYARQFNFHCYLNLRKMIISEQVKVGIFIFKNVQLLW